MGDLGEQYIGKVSGILKNIVETQKAAIGEAATVIAREIANGKLIYVFGTGAHCTRAAEELFWRAGGLVTIAPILDAGLALIHGATRATMTERMRGYARNVLDYYRVGQGDTLILVNSYGINSLTIDTALECRDRGTKVIAVTSFEFPKGVPPDHPARHPSGQNLHEIADIAINNFVPFGDAVVDVEGFPFRVAAVSTIANVFILNVIVSNVVDRLVREGRKPPVWVSANAPGGDAWNKGFLAEYIGRIRHL